MQGRKAQRTFSGSGADEDIVVSSARAYVSGLNKLVAFMKTPKVSLSRCSLSLDFLPILQHGARHGGA